MAFIVRSTDETLKAALLRWYAEEGRRFGGQYVFTDTDSMPPLGTEGEITCSRSDGAALRRPFLFSELAGMMEAKGKAGRLLFLEDGVLLDGKKLALTETEAALLRILDRAEEPLDASALSEMLGKEEPRSNRIAVHIAALRRKTEGTGGARLIRTAHGKGYYIDHG